MSIADPAPRPASPVERPRRRGSLRIYLGAAPGVGKTFAMLNEGRRRAARGTDVVAGFVETHGRAATAEQIGDLEVVPRRVIEHRGATFEEMDVDAVLARQPQVALVDELAHTNVPGSRHAKRHQDVVELLDAGIDVVSTVNIQHLESLNDVVEAITGVVQRETVPDHVVRAAEQVELVDMTPEALRRRMAHGNVYAPDTVDAALTNYFRAGNLTALRELALLWVADRVDDALESYRDRHGITEPWETRERVVVALTGAPGTEALIRRAARITQRGRGELLAVHVRSEEGLAGGGEVLAGQRRLVEELGGSFYEVGGSDVAAALVDFARAENATQVVLGASRRSFWSELLRGSVINRVVRLSGRVDVHVISHLPPDDGTPAGAVTRRHPPSLPPRRRQLGWALAAAGVPLLTLVLYHLRGDIGLPSVLLLYLLLVVVTASLGGLLPALAAAVAGFLCANWFFTPPYHRLAIAEAENLLALVVFLVVASTVSTLVALAARRAAEAARATAEAESLAGLAGTVAEPDPLPVLLDRLRSAFGLRGAALLREGAPRARPGQGAWPTADPADDEADRLRRAGEPDAGRWVVEAAAGQDVPQVPAAADEVRRLGDDLVLALSGPDLAAEDRRVLNAFVAQLGAAVERRRLHAQAGQAAALVEANALRTALLQAVSHDLRTPLAGIKASASSLRQADVEWSDDDVQEFLGTIEDETDRLTTLVGNLLDMSRIQAGVVAPARRAVGLDEVVPAALAGLGPRGRTVEVDVDETLPAVLADPALLERVIANLVDNALHHGGGLLPAAGPVRVTAGEVGGRVLIRVVDHGPGIPPAQHERVFQPFQRLGDAADSNEGMGLGLAVARGFTRTMGGELTIEDTPAGGTTMVVELEAATT